MLTPLQKSHKCYLYYEKKDDSYRLCSFRMYYIYFGYGIFMQGAEPQAWGLSS